MELVKYSGFKEKFI